MRLGELKESNHSRRFPWEWGASTLVLFLLALLGGVVTLYTFYTIFVEAGTDLAEVVESIGQLEDRVDEMQELPGEPGLQSDGSGALDDLGVPREPDGTRTERPLSVRVFSRASRDEPWSIDGTNVLPGQQIQYLIRFENSAKKPLRDVMVGVNLPNHVTYVENSTALVNGNNPEGRIIDTDNVAAGGINVGHYMPKAAGYVLLTVEVDPTSAFAELGTYTLNTVGIVRPQGMNEFYNVAHVDVEV